LLNVKLAVHIVTTGLYSVLQSVYALPNRTRYAVLFNGTPQPTCAHFLNQKTYSSLEGISQSKTGEILSAVLAFLKLSVRSPTPPPPHPSPSVTISCPQPALLHRQCKPSEATGGYRRPRTAGSRELGHQNAINLGHFNSLRPATFPCLTVTTTQVTPLHTVTCRMG
jgi:hypothetical protein